MFNLKGKVVIVTGARRGIGKGIAERLAEAGAQVVVSDLSYDDCQAVCHDIGTRFKILTLPVACDVSNRASVEQLTHRAVEHFHKIDILVNNAGIFFAKPFLDYTEEDWDKIIAVNLKSIFLCSQAAARVMIQRRYGKIVNIASIAGIIGYPGAAAYCASKGGIITFTKEMALELAPYKVNVNAIAPGLIETPMTQFIVDDKPLLEQTLQAIPWKRQGQPSDIAHAVHYLVSDEADYVTGQTLVVDGQVSKLGCNIALKD
ncbi:SDR family oxidoreductase [Candidatus Woesearchaeota archaeon]|nr:SDR family oxidoreductase [Candidatus Woesearchaeota archaeon]